MTYDSVLYVIERIRTKSGAVHEREARRKGHRVKVEWLTLGSGMIARYIDEDNAFLRTSHVEVFNVEGDGSPPDYLVVQTRDSVYSFRKINEEESV